MAQKNNPEFSRVIDASDVESKPRHEKIEATLDECIALAKRFNILKIKSLSAHVRLKREQADDLVKIDGTLNADVEQACVVTLEPVLSHVTATFEAYFTEKNLPSRNDPDYDPLAVEIEPDQITNGKIDIGELVAEHLSLELNPYPKKEGVDFLQIAEANEIESTDTPLNPFSVLKELKDKKE